MKYLTKNRRRTNEKPDDRTSEAARLPSVRICGMVIRCTPSHSTNESYGKKKILLLRTSGTHVSLSIMRYFANCRVGRPSSSRGTANAMVEHPAGAALSLRVYPFTTTRSILKRSDACKAWGIPAGMTTTSPCFTVTSLSPTVIRASPSST